MCIIKAPVSYGTDTTDKQRHLCGKRARSSGRNCFYACKLTLVSEGADTGESVQVPEMGRIKYSAFWTIKGTDKLDSRTSLGQTQTDLRPCHRETQASV